MKIIKRGYGYMYAFRCPRCGSELEAEESEINVRLHYADIWFDCPACQATRCCISLHNATKYIKYDNNEEES